MGSKRAVRTRQLLEKQQEILRDKERLSLDQKTGLYGERAEYQSIVECLLEKFAALRYEFTNQTITCSAGLAFLEKGVDAKMLFDQADQALYQSKAEGKNRLTVFLYQNEEEKVKCLTKS